MKIEFFHDVICSFCFPMSYRMRKIQEEFPNIDIQHRSFALAWQDEDLAVMFGSREKAKDEILSHWKQANENDELHRFNIEGMKDKTFLFPLSRPVLLAVKAAEKISGSEAYWDLFDSLQYQLFSQSKDINDVHVIQEAVKEIGLDEERWNEAYQSQEVLDLVMADFEQVKHYGVQGVPFLVINEKYSVSGAQSMAVIRQTIRQIAEDEKENAVITPSIEGETCYIDKDGTWYCE